MSTAGTLYEAAAVGLSPQYGVLRLASATALSYLPYGGGDQLLINGVSRTIPATGNGIVGLGNTGVFVNGVAGQESR